MDVNGTITKLENHSDSEGLNCDNLILNNSVDDNDYRNYSVHYSKFRNILKFLWKQKCKILLLFKQAPLLKFWKKNAEEQDSKYKDVDSSEEQLSQFEKTHSIALQKQQIGKNKN